MLATPTGPYFPRNKSSHSHSFISAAHFFQGCLPHTELWAVFSLVSHSGAQALEPDILVTNRIFVLMSSVTLGKLPSVSVPQFPYW